MKVSLINPSSPFLIDESVAPPLVLGFLATWLAKHGFQVAYEHQLVTGEATRDADAYLLTATTPQYSGAVEIAETLDSWTALGGAHATCYLEETSPFSAIFKGYGFDKVEEAIRDRRFGVISSPVPDRPLYELDELDRKLVPFHRYALSLPEGRFAACITSFGCPFSCAFCSKPVFKTRIYFRPEEAIKDELSQIKAEGFQGVMFYDDTFTVSKERALRIAEACKQLGLGIRCMSRAELLTEELADRLHKLGCVEIGLGIESGSDEILKRIGKAPAEAQAEAIRLLKRFGIRVKGFFIIGLPGENRQTLRETQQFLDSAPLDDYDFCLFVPYRGSPIGDAPEAWGIKLRQSYTDAWYKGRPGLYRSVVKTEELTSDELERAREKFEKRYKRW